MALRVAARVNLHDADAVQACVEQTLAILDLAFVPPELRPALAPGILSLLSQQHVEIEQTQLGLGRLDVPRGH